MHSATLLAFVAVAAIAIVTPGPTVLLAFSNGSRFGIRRPCQAWPEPWHPTQAGRCRQPDSALFWRHRILVLGAEMGWRCSSGLSGRDDAERSTGSLTLPKDGLATPQKTAFGLFLKSFIVAVTNPKGYLFVSAFLAAIHRSRATANAAIFHIGDRLCLDRLRDHVRLRRAGLPGRQSVGRHDGALAGSSVRRRIAGACRVAGLLPARCDLSPFEITTLVAKRDIDITTPDGS